MDTQNLTFSYSVSTREYNRNKDERQTPFLQWQEKQGTIKDLESDIKNGFAFCPTFNHDGATFTNRAKTKTNLKATYFITFDFDAVKLTAGQFYGSMIGTGLTPSMVYTTANNGNFKQGKNETYCNRYRVIYLIDEPITTAEDYTAIHTALKTESMIPTFSTIQQTRTLATFTQVAKTRTHTATTALYLCRGLLIDTALS